jgi:phosphoglycerate dehydrogenase-like enzyme
MGPGRVRTWFRSLLEPTGATVVDDPAEAEALVWIDPHDSAGLAALLDEHGHIGWVQLPFAGVDRMIAAGLIRPGDGRVWTAAKGVYAEPVAEHALALLLAGLRNFGEYARADSWGAGRGRTLFGAKVTILGAGGIAEALLRLLAPFRVEATLVRRQPEPRTGGARLGSQHGGSAGDTPAAPRVVGRDGLHGALADADAVILALALTPETRGIVAEPELRAMSERAWLINVARGAHVVTDDLVRALAEGWIAGAGLDVADPEPLPDGHPLWSLRNCIITPHCASPQELAAPRLAARIAENARRFAAGEELLGIVDAQHGY